MLILLSLSSTSLACAKSAMMLFSVISSSRLDAGDRVGLEKLGHLVGEVRIQEALARDVYGDVQLQALLPPIDPLQQRLAQNVASEWMY